MVQLATAAWVRPLAGELPLAMGVAKKEREREKGMKKGKGGGGEEMLASGNLPLAPEKQPKSFIIDHPYPSK